jgi:hypothetical protein
VAEQDSGPGITAASSSHIEPGRDNLFNLIKSWIVGDFVRVVDGLLVEHWDVVEDEASQADSKSGRPMFGDRFPA